MGLFGFLQAIQLRRKQRKLLQGIDRSPIGYSNAPGDSLDDPIVVTGAKLDIEGTAAVFAWLIRQHGTMDVDWRLHTKSGAASGDRHIDIYRIQLRSGEERTFYFDVSESFGRWS